MKKVWFITGASRGLGFELAKAALAAGDFVAAAGRNPAAVEAALGQSEDLLTPALDVSLPEQAESAVKAALDRFGRIDVLVNNAGYGQLGAFENSTQDEIDQQFRVNLFGAMNVTRAVLPAMRKARSGRIFNISSLAGLRGSALNSLYCSVKFALEGWSESLEGELAPFGIHVAAIEPGFFRTDFLEQSSVRYNQSAVPDYEQAAAEHRAFFEQRSRNQAGDPARLAQALLQLADEPNLPQHFVAGTDAIAVLEQRIERDRQQLVQWRKLSASTDYPA